jgi:hypothetical protein
VQRLQLQLHSSALVHRFYEAKIFSGKAPKIPVGDQSVESFHTQRLNVDSRNNRAIGRTHLVGKGGMMQEYVH